MKIILIAIAVFNFLYADQCQKYIDNATQQYKKVQASIRFKETPNIVDVGMTKHYMINAYSECEGKVSDKKMKAIETIIKNMQEMEKDIKNINNIK